MCSVTLNYIEKLCIKKIVRSNFIIDNPILDTVGILFTHIFDLQRWHSLMRQAFALVPPVFPGNLDLMHACSNGPIACSVYPDQSAGHKARPPGDGGYTVPMCAYMHNVPCVCNASSTWLHGGHMEVDHCHQLPYRWHLLSLDGILTYKGPDSQCVSSSVAGATSENELKHWPPYATMLSCSTPCRLKLNVTKTNICSTPVSSDNQRNISLHLHISAL